MSPKCRVEGKPVVHKPVTAWGQDRLSRPNHTHPVTVEDFDRERMGIAAKE